LAALIRPLIPPNAASEVAFAASTLPLLLLLLELLPPLLQPAASTTLVTATAKAASVFLLRTFPSDLRKPLGSGREHRRGVT
jgi:hypothetical protein